MEIVSIPVLRGTATGKSKNVPGLGVTTLFNEKINGRVKTLQHHVPLECRGDYRPTELSNYKAAKKYRLDSYGKVLCFASTKSTGTLCNRRAINRSPFCGSHGGALHPYDQVVREDKDVSELTRFEQFKAGVIGIEDLDDEELATSSFRAKDGRLYQPKNLPSNIVNEFTKALFARATSEMQKNAVEAVVTAAEIMKSSAVDPEVRLKAATFFIERNMGKTPQTVNVNVNAPWEQIFDSIGHERQEQGSIGPGIVDAEYTELDEFGHPIDTGELIEQTDGESDKLQFDVGRLMSTDQPTVQDRLGIPYARIPEPEISLDDAKKSRDPAILAKEKEVPDFEYDFSSSKDEIDKQRRRRFVARNLGLNNVEDLGNWKPLVRKEVINLEGGLIRILWHSPSF